MKIFIRLVIVALAVASVAILFSLIPGADGQPMPTCSPGQACKVLSITTTKKNGAGVILSGDAGVRFGDGTIMNTAAASGVTPSGSPASTDVAVFSGASAITGDSHFTWSSNVLQLGTGTVIRPESGAMDLRTQPGNALTLQRGTNTGDATNIQWQLLAGNGRTNQLTIDGSSAASPATITASGGDTNIAISMTGKGTGAAMSQNTGYGTYSSRPTAANSGRVYYATDAPVATWVDTGSAWAPLVLGQVLGTQPKAAATFTVFNRGGGTVPTLADLNGALHIASATDATNNVLSGFTEALSSATMHVEGAAIINSPRTSGVTSSFYSAGVVMRESGTGKAAYLEVFVNDTLANDPAIAVGASYWASSTSRTSDDVFTLEPVNGPIFLKIARSGSNIIWQTSTDNNAWTTIKTTATSTVYTTAPDSVGVGVNLGSGNVDFIGADIISYNSGS